jgi:hypothetical protein
MYLLKQLPVTLAAHAVCVHMLPGFCRSMGSCSWPLKHDACINVWGDAQLKLLKHV